MTDKPLDCVGIDPTKQNIGKHDFRPSIPGEPVGKCGRCNLELNRIVGYVCSHSGCPTGFGSPSA